MPRKGANLKRPPSALAKQEALRAALTVELTRLSFPHPHLWAVIIVYSGFEAARDRFVLVILNAIDRVQANMHNVEVMDTVWGAIRPTPLPDQPELPKLIYEVKLRRPKRRE